jgi:hypothetical protein
MALETSPASWPVRVAPLGPVSMASTLWRWQGRLYVTVVVKASFAFSLNDEMSCIASEPVRRADECARGVPSLRAASELAPQLGDVDVTLHGHAYAPAGSTRWRVRLGIERDGRLVLDKTLFVYGNRKRSKPDPVPFERMRIGYERALGGIGFHDNPIGVGVDAGGDSLPNVLHPTDPNGRVAGFGAIPCRFPARRKRRGKVDQAVIENGIADYPPDFDWGYFQASPEDQRLPALRGDEWLVLEGLHPSYPLIRTRLPSPKAVARIYSRKSVGAPDTVPLRADMLHVESGEARCSVLWRGSFPIASELAAEELCIAGALELRHNPVSFPASIAEVLATASPEVDTARLQGRADDDLQRTAESSASPRGKRVPPAPPSSWALEAVSGPGEAPSHVVSPAAGGADPSGLGALTSTQPMGGDSSPADDTPRMPDADEWSNTMFYGGSPLEPQPRESGIGAGAPAPKQPAVPDHAVPPPAPRRK